jgi:phosphopantetheine adenylyltransferase
MDEYYDDDFEINKSDKNKTQNPAGPYHIEIMFRGVVYNLIIKNVNHKKFKVEAHVVSDEVEDFDYESNVKALNRYLDLEGFFLAARKHNLYYK